VNCEPIGPVYVASNVAFARVNTHPKTPPRGVLDLNSSNPTGSEETTPFAPAPKLLAPKGIPVPNRPGFITSPLAPDQGLIDVRGIPSGTEIRDPYSNQTITVP